MQGVVTKVEVEEPEVRDLPADKPRCAHGESCYSKNTAHFVQMSHPRGVFFSRVQQPAAPSALSVCQSCIMHSTRLDRYWLRLSVSELPCMKPVGEGMAGEG